jgi:hypothetical protein
MVLPFKANAEAVAFTLAKAAVLPTAALRVKLPPVPEAFKVRARAVLPLLTVPFDLIDALDPVACMVVLAPKVMLPV